MTPQSFRLLLASAVNGSDEAFERLMSQYAPLIDRNSYLNRRLDEDLRQSILLHVAKAIRKYKLDYMERNI